VPPVPWWRPPYADAVARLRIAACQINTIVGDLDGNAERVLAALEQAEAAGADVAVFKPSFVKDNQKVLERVAERTGRCAAVLGFVDSGLDIYNAAAVCANGTVHGVYRKRLLPNYAVFDEQRYFTAGSEPLKLFLIGGVRAGISICEDIWSPAGPMSSQAAGGAEVILNLNASPYYAGRLEERERMLATRAADASCALVYVNQIGGQDELVFDGASMVIDGDGHTVASFPQFVDGTFVVDLEVRPSFRKRLLDPRGRTTTELLPVVEVSAEPVANSERAEPGCVQPLERCEEVYRALVVGTRDYIRKNGFTDVVLGLSGGIDSSIVTVIAADAIGPENVHAVALPSRYSSEGSITDAEKLAANLGIDLRTIAIEPAFAPMLEVLAPSFEGMPEDITEENLQGRIRAALLMALSNKRRSWLVLICGNKSELAVGYTTVYGVDMAGGFAVIKDVFKTEVYELARWRNRSAGYDLIPESVITKPPSAELRPGQRDDQSLPPYEVLDPILEAYVEHDQTVADLIAAGHDAELVRRLTRMVDVAEWKRRQAPVGVRISPKAFGKDRRMPITNGYRG
jgi:NAD+ synthase (glutamine-hydrolysing)